MNLSEIIEGLEDLAEDRKSLIKDLPDWAEDDEFRGDYNVTQEAIKCIRELEQIKQQDSWTETLSDSSRLKKSIKYLLAVLSTAWHGALAIFSTIVFSTALFKFVDRFLNNDVFACAVLALMLIAITFILGTTVNDKVNKK